MIHFRNILDLLLSDWFRVPTSFHIAAAQLKGGFLSLVKISRAISGSTPRAGCIRPADTQYPGICPPKQNPQLTPGQLPSHPTAGSAIFAIAQ